MLIEVRAVNFGYGCTVISPLRTLNFMSLMRHACESSNDKPIGSGASFCASQQKMGHINRFKSMGTSIFLTPLDSGRLTITLSEHFSWGQFASPYYSLRSCKLLLRGV